MQGFLCENLYLLTNKKKSEKLQAQSFSIKLDFP